MSPDSVRQLAFRREFSGAGTAEVAFEVFLILPATAAKSVIFAKTRAASRVGVPNNLELYGSNWDSACVEGDNPVRMRQYLAARKLDPARGLRVLGTSVIHTDWLASTL